MVVPDAEQADHETASDDVSALGMVMVMSHVAWAANEKTESAQPKTADANAFESSLINSPLSRSNKFADTGILVAQQDPCKC